MASVVGRKSETAGRNRKGQLGCSSEWRVRFPIVDFGTMHSARLEGSGTVPFQASAGPRTYRQLDEEAAAGAESHRLRPAPSLTGSEFMPGPNDSIGHETFMPSPSRVHPGQSLPSPGRSGSRATDYLPNSGPRATDYLPGRVPIPAAGYAAGAGYVRGYDGFDAEWHLPAQPSKGDAPLDTEFTLLSREHPSTASRVERLPLTHGERDMVSYAPRRVQGVGLQAVISPRASPAPFCAKGACCVYGAEDARRGRPSAPLARALLPPHHLPHSAKLLHSTCTQALRRADEFATTAREWSSLGNRLYTAQIVAAASVPVLVG
jgi:hypothetical protein